MKLLDWKYIRSKNTKYYAAYIFPFSLYGISSKNCFFCKYLSTWNLILLLEGLFKDRHAICFPLSPKSPSAPKYYMVLSKGAKGLSKPKGFLVRLNEGNRTKKVIQLLQECYKSSSYQRKIKFPWGLDTQPQLHVKLPMMGWSQEI